MGSAFFFALLFLSAFFTGAFFGILDAALLEKRFGILRSSLVFVALCTVAVAFTMEPGQHKANAVALISMVGFIPLTATYFASRFLVQTIREYRASGINSERRR